MEAFWRLSFLQRVAAKTNGAATVTPRTWRRPRPPSRHVGRRNNNHPPPHFHPLPVGAPFGVGVDDPDTVAPESTPATAIPTGGLASGLSYCARPRSARCSTTPIRPSTGVAPRTGRLDDTPPLPCRGAHLSTCRVERLTRWGVFGRCRRIGASPTERQLWNCSRLSTTSHRHDRVLPSLLSRRVAVQRPFRHQPASLLEQIATPICGLDLVADRMRERHLDNLAREVRALGRPISERRAEAMHGDVAAPHAPQHLRHRHVGQRLAGLAAGEDVVGSSHVVLVAQDRERAACFARDRFIKVNSPLLSGNNPQLKHGNHTDEQNTSEVEAMT